MSRFKSLETFMAAVKAIGGKVRKTTVSNHNTYYQAIKDDQVIGFFNTAEGKKGKAPKGSQPDSPGGEIANEHMQIDL